MAEEQRQDGVFDFHRLYAVDFWRDSILSRRSSLTQDEEELVEAVKQIARENAAVQRQKKMDRLHVVCLLKQLQLAPRQPWGRERQSRGRRDGGWWPGGR